jgi:hypothetical protein
VNGLIEKFCAPVNMVAGNEAMGKLIIPADKCGKASPDPFDSRRPL